MSVIILLSQAGGVIFSELYLLGRKYQKETDPSASLSEAILKQVLTASGGIAVLLLVFSVLMALSILSLGCYHTFLIIAAQTTHEHQRGFYEARDAGSPWDRGAACDNCAQSLCAPWTPSFVYLEELEEGQQNGLSAQL